MIEQNRILALDNSPTPWLITAVAGLMGHLSRWRAETLLKQLGRQWGDCSQHGLADQDLVAVVSARG